jgi:hypothetical protein
MCIVREIGQSDEHDVLSEYHSTVGWDEPSDSQQILAMR